MLSVPLPHRKQPLQRHAGGVLASQQLRALVTKRIISGKPAIEERQYQPASLDLRLGETAYRMLSSFLPEQWAISQRLTVSDLLPELQFHSHDRLKLSVALLAGIGVAVLIGQFEPKDHGSEAPPAAESAAMPSN